jgi:hypothetical protein
MKRKCECSGSGMAWSAFSKDFEVCICVDTDTSHLDLEPLEEPGTEMSDIQVSYKLQWLNSSADQWWIKDRS